LRLIHCSLRFVPGWFIQVLGRESEL
jgi:hypothetical protein